MEEENMMERIKALLKWEIAKPYICWVAVGVMLALIFIYLLGVDFSSAPEFVYNQF